MAGPFGDVVRSSLAKEAYGPVYSAQYADAMKSAQANEVARRVGVSPEIVESAMPDMLAEDRLRKRLALIASNQAYAQMMSRPRFAAAAIDDDELPKVAEKVGRHVAFLSPAYVGMLTVGAGRRAVGLLGGLSRASAALYGSVGLDALARRTRSGARWAEGIANAGPEGLPIARWEDVKRNPLLAPRFGFEQIALSLPDMLATMNPLTLAAYVIARSGEIGQQRAEADNRTDSTLVDTAIASPYAVASALLERAGVKGIALGIKNATARSIIQAATREAGTEFVQSGLEYTGAQAGTETGWNAVEALDQMLAGSVGGFFGGGIVTGAGAGVKRVADKVNQRHRDVQTTIHVDRIMEGAAKSATRTANPTDFEEALNQLVGDTEAERLFIPADRVQALFQDDDGAVARDIREDPFWGDYAGQVEEAAALGGDVVVPLASAATHLAGSPDWQHLREHVRTRPGGASMVEAKTQDPEELEKIAADLAGQLDEKMPQLHAQRLTQEFARTLGYEGEQAEAITRLVSAATVRAHAVESAKRISRGEPAPALDEFAAGWMPQAVRTTQAEYEARSGDGFALAQDGKPVTQSGLPTAGEIDDQAIAAEGVTIGDVRKSAERYYAEHFLGTSITTSDGRDVQFNARGLRKTTRAGEDLLRVVPAIPAILQNGVPLQTDAPAKSDTGTKAMHRYGAIVGIGGKTLPVVVLVRETHDGHFHYSLHHWREVAGRPAEAGRDTAKGGHRTALEGAPSRTDIGENGDDFNDTQSRGNISLQRGDDTLMTGAIIRAFESANFSTAVHELGHFFLEDLRRRALSGDATDQERADWEAFKDWALNDLGGLQIADDAAVPTEAHEFWARGFERYIWEGKAPSTGLRSIFARMRDFMLSLYRAASSFNAPITPEIREVMDRMLASDDEINAQREELRLADEAIADLMSADERTAYAEMGDEARQAAREGLFNSVLSTLRRERAEEVRVRKAEIKAEVEAEVDEQPIFRALKLLRGGQPQEDGTVARVTLSRQWIVDAYGEDMLGRLPRGVPPIVDDNHAMDADVIANLTGFSSSDQMIRDLVDQETHRRRMKEQGDKRSPRRVLVEDVTDARLRDEIGDPFATLDEEAQAALANDRQADRLSMELRALARKTGRKPTAWKLASEWARRHVRAQSSRDATSGTAMQMYARNAAKAAQRVEEALIGQKFDEAFQAKQQQLLNMALMAQAKLAKDEIDKAVRRLQKIAGKATIATVDQDYLDQAHQLLEQVDMKTRPYARDDKRLAFEAWHGQQVAKGIEPVVPPEYRALLGRTNWAKLSIEGLLELDKTVGQVIELGRLKQRLKDGKEERDFNEAVAELEAAAGGGSQRPRTRENDPNRSLGGRIKSRLRGIDAAMIKIEQMADWLDGGDPNGPWNRLLFRMAAEAQGRENDLMRAYIEEINGLIKALPKAQVRAWDRNVDTPELTIRVPGHPQAGEAWQFRKDQIVMMAMNWGNEGNRQRLMDGFGWDEAQVNAVLDRMMTKEDWDFVQSVWSTIDKLWPEIEALERRVNGVAPEKIEATEVQTPYGVYRGGYFPAVYDPSYSTRAELDEASKLAPNGAWHQATTRASAAKSRVAQVKNRPLLLNMGVITRHLGEVIHDVTHREAVVQMRKILVDSRVRTAIDNALGPEYRKRMDAWVENLATPNASNSKSDPSMVGIARHLNKGISLTGLGFRISTVLVQPLGMANMTAALGEKAMLNGIRIFTASPIKVYNEITSRSAEMRSRFSTMDASIDEMAKDAAAGKLRLIGAGWFTRHAFDGILYMDMLITSAGWVGAFNKGLAEGMNEDDAGAYADKIIRTSQGAGGQKDRSAILYENQFARTFWPFFSYLNALYNQQRDVFHRGRRVESVSEGVDVARRAWWIFVVPTVLQAILLGQGPEDDDEDGEVGPGEWSDYLTKAVILGNFASIPGIGPIVQAIGSGYGYRSNAFQGIGEDIERVADAAGRIAEGEAELTGSTIRGLLSTIGIVTAKPLGQAGATAQGAYDYATGEAEPEDAGDVLETIMRGRPSPEPTAVERVLGEQAE